MAPIVARVTEQQRHAMLDLVFRSLTSDQPRLLAARQLVDATFYPATMRVT